MTLRTKLLAMFAALGVVPLLGMGVLGYVQSTRAVESQIEAQTRLIAERAATELRRRIDAIDAELLLIAENAESQRLLRAVRGGAGAPAAAFAAARNFLDPLWAELSQRYTALELQDTRGNVLLRWAAASDLPSSVAERTIPLRVVATDWESGDTIGAVTARVQPFTILPGDALENRFGSSGLTAVLDAPDVNTADEDLIPSALLARLSAPSGRLRYRQNDTARAGWFVAVDRPLLTIFSSTAVDEFAGPFERMRSIQLGIILAVILAVTVAFALLLRRATRSLEELTRAADLVGQGNLDPRLPGGSTDEVGRLANSFQLMLTRLREMMLQIEQSRQLAAIGEFAAELSHEIRNPLTSVKLNLQRIERLTENGKAAPELAKPVALALREIRRLDRVVRGVLQLGRAQPLERAEIEVHRLVEHAVALARPQAEEHAVDVSVENQSADAVVSADAEQVQAALLNVLLNAIEAMPNGGSLHVRVSDDEDHVAIDVSDTGVGVGEEARKQLFRPFFTTKKEGSGIGLPLALRTMEAHGGSIELVHSSPEGSQFRITLPLMVRGVAV